MVREPIEFVARDGVRLRGIVEGDGPSLAVLVHDRGRDLDAHASLAGALLDADLSVLRFDLRGHGLSDGEWNEAEAHLDVEAAIRCASRRAPGDIFLVAVGFGAAVGVVARTQARALVLVSPPGIPFGHEHDEARESTAPKLLLVGSQDEQAERAADQLQRMLIGPRLLVHLPTGEQGHALYEGECRRQAISQTVGFLAQHRTAAPVV